MFSSFLLLSLASVHSFCFVAATPDPKITDSPQNVARQTPQSSSFILSTVSYQYPDVPYQVDPFPVGRGPQSGYNQCNSSTEGQNSLCQTMFINNIVCIFKRKECLACLTILPIRPTFAYGVHLWQMALLETRKPQS